MQGGDKMELGKQIKMHRQEAHLSQEELANRVYVSRQTISNWENDKSYPDVNSLVLLSEIFQISLDKLIKGDIEVMKDVIQKEEIEKMNRYGRNYTILLIATVVSAAPLFVWLGLWAFIPWGILWAFSMYFALKIEKIKKDNDVQTYKEIVAFYEGKRLDDIQEQREIGKRPYQKILLVIGSALITLVTCVVIGFLMHIFLN
jgi:transcriptional regulator with XRE-family HTH domain